MRFGKTSNRLDEGGPARRPSPDPVFPWSGAALCCAIVLLIATACTPTLERRVLEYERRVNAGDVDGTLELFADSAIVEQEQSYTLVGKSDIRGLAEWDSVLQTQVTFYDIRTMGDTVVADVVESSAWLDAVGIPEILHPGTSVIFRDGFIIRLVSTTDTADARAIRRALDEVLTWAFVDRPETVRKLVSEERVVYNGESAALLKNLLSEWTRTQSTSP